MKIVFSSGKNSSIFSLLTPAARFPQAQKQKQRKKEAPEWWNLILVLAENSSVKLLLVN